MMVTTAPWILPLSTAAALGTLFFNWQLRFDDAAATSTNPSTALQTHVRTPLDDIYLFSPRFSCGGGPFSNTMASLVSFPCDVEEIHDCCVKHDHCYDARVNQTTCDNAFCDCLQRVPYNGAFCHIAATKGLCLATHVFGHLFYDNDSDVITDPAHLLT